MEVIRSKPAEDMRIRGLRAQQLLRGDIEVVFLYPVALQLEALGWFALGETMVFVLLLLVAFVFVWRRGALEWK